VNDHNIKESMILICGNFHSECHVFVIKDVIRNEDDDGGSFLIATCQKKTREFRNVLHRGGQCLLFWKNDQWEIHGLSLDFIMVVPKDSTSVFRNLEVEKHNELRRNIYDMNAMVNELQMRIANAKQSL